MYYTSSDVSCSRLYRPNCEQSVCHSGAAIAYTARAGVLPPHCARDPETSLRSHYTQDPRTLHLYCWTWSYTYNDRYEAEASRGPRASKQGEQGQRLLPQLLGVLEQCSSVSLAMWQTDGDDYLLVDFYNFTGAIVSLFIFGTKMCMTPCTHCVKIWMRSRPNEGIRTGVPKYYTK